MNTINVYIEPISYPYIILGMNHIYAPHWTIRQN